jgi:hypothetical protein
LSSSDKIAIKPSDFSPGVSDAHKLAAAAASAAGTMHNTATAHNREEAGRARERFLGGNLKNINR